MSGARRLHPDDIEWIAQRVVDLLHHAGQQPEGGSDADDRLLTAKEVAALLGVSERYVWTLGREAVLPRVKVGSKYVRFPRAAVLVQRDSGSAVEAMPSAPS